MYSSLFRQAVANATQKEQENLTKYTHEHDNVICDYIIQKICQ